MRFSRIKGDGPQNIIRLPRLGKIRLGVKAVSKSGKEYPKETSFFVCPDEVKKKFGEQPTRLPVMLATEDDEQNYRQYYSVYGSNQRLKCQGDGETAERRNEKGEIEKMECPTPDHCEYAKANGKDGKPGCRSRFDLMVVLPDVSVGGVYQISTGSINSDIDIRSGILMARNLYGRASWVPMEVVREPMKIAEPGTNKMNTHYPVKLQPIGNLETVMAVRKDPMLIPTGETTRYLLPEPIIEGEEPDTPVISEMEEPEGTNNGHAAKEVQPQAQPEAAAKPKDAGPGKEYLIFTLQGAKTGVELTDLWRTVFVEIKDYPAKDKQEVQHAYEEKMREFKKKK